MYNTFQKLLDQKGVTAYKVAKETGLTTATLTNWKKGRYTPKQDKLQKIAEYFDVTVDYLLTGEDAEPDPASINVNDELSKILQSLDAGTALYPSGRLPETPEERDLIAASLKTVMAHVETLDRAMNKSDKKD